MVILPDISGSRNGGCCEGEGSGGWEPAAGWVEDWVEETKTEVGGMEGWDSWAPAWGRDGNWEEEEEGEEEKGHWGEETEGREAGEGAWILGAEKEALAWG